MNVKYSGRRYPILMGYCLQDDVLGFLLADLSNTVLGQQQLGNALFITTSGSCGQMLFGDYMTVDKTFSKYLNSGAGPGPEEEKVSSHSK